MLALLTTAVLVGIGYEQTGRLRATSKYAPPGEMVAVNGAEIHLNCSGEGSPVVLLESGLGPFASAQWFELQPRVATFTRVCSYDRAGLLWSRLGESPRSAENMVNDLHALLEAANVAPPYVAVAHSFGALLTRMYADRFPGQVSGFVFIDASHPYQEERFGRAGSRPSPQRAPWRDFLLREIGVTRLSVASSPPPEDIPGDVFAPVAAFLPRQFEGQVAEAAALDETLRQAQQLDGRAGALDARPVVVLTRGVFESEDERVIWMELQRELAQLSTNADHRIVNEAEHTIHIDDPGAVIEAIRDVVTSARNGGELRAGGTSP